MSEYKETIGERFCNVIKDVGVLGRDGEYKDSRKSYGYVSSDKAYQVIGQAMSKNGLSYRVSILDEDTTIIERQGKTPFFSSKVWFSVVFVSAEGEKSEPVTWIGRGTSYEAIDKAAYGAITSGVKYFLMKQFVVGSGNEDSEHDNHVMPDEHMTRDFHKKGRRNYGDDWDSKRPVLVNSITKGRTSSSQDLTRDEMSFAINGMDKKHKTQQETAVAE